MPWSELYAYWKSKHVDGRPPSRRSIEPIGEIPRLAPRLMLIDIVPEGYRYRLVGSEIVRRSGFDLTGKLVGSTGHGMDIKSEWYVEIDDAFRSRCPKLLLLRIAPALKVQILMLALPLVLENGETEMLLVGAFHEGRLEPPYRVEGLKPLDISL